MHLKLRFACRGPGTTGLCPFPNLLPAGVVDGECLQSPTVSPHSEGPPDGVTPFNGPRTNPGCENKQQPRANSKYDHTIQLYRGSTRLPRFGASSVLAAPRLTVAAGTSKTPAQKSVHLPPRDICLQRLATKRVGQNAATHPGRCPVQTAGHAP